MSHGVLDILRYFLLALIWLFFLYAIRAVYVEVRRARDDVKQAGQAALPQGSPPLQDKPTTLRLQVVEPGEKRGRTFDLSSEVTLGRTAGCAVSLKDDAYASSVHARIFEKSGELWIEDLGSRNGTYLNEERLVAPARLRRGDKVKAGATVFEVTR